jgi:hypothetical protein
VSLTERAKYLDGAAALKNAAYGKHLDWSTKVLSDRKEPHFTPVNITRIYDYG